MSPRPTARAVPAPAFVPTLVSTFASVVIVALVVSLASGVFTSAANADERADERADDQAGSGVPRITVDIPPLHSLVSMVTGELARPALLVRAGSSPHTHALRPSEAAALEASDVVFWNSVSLTPWLAREIDKLAPRARHVELMAREETITLAPRRGATFEQHTHGDAGHGDAGHEGHGHGTRHDGEHAGTDDTLDPHGWLDPRNAQRWLDTIAATLATLDPPNAAHYRANAATARAAIEALIERTTRRLAGLRDRPFVVFHDSFHYFERRFDLAAAAALSASDASEAGPARVQRVRDVVAGFDNGCVFTEPQLSARRARLLLDGLDVGRGVLDPLGATLAPGPDLYETLIDDLAEAFAACLGGRDADN